MAKQRISDKACEAILMDNELGLAVCEELGVRFSALPSYLIRRSPSLTYFNVVQVIADKTGMSFGEILENKVEKTNVVNA
ncbi:hypothetical protein QTN47_17180 [Danxiaibacter flavus]|uniref:XRE family transcriptional regulator n=1 Tax=Danxiaibacter flavus TaxID=3049108 RepID=A0ABV3ZH77_9BACT|nr:hypothetical protein QNM32_17190 [Chitinophagaceae bacterium DXS]